MATYYTLKYYKAVHNYINSRLGKVFMNPKVKRLITQYQEENNEAAIITLWEDFQPLVISLIKRFYISLDNKEDVAQDAFVKLLECAKSYDLSKSVPFESYFKMNLNYWFLNRIKKKSELLVIDHNWNQGLSMADLIESTLGNCQELLELSETTSSLQKALKSLTSKQKQAVTLYYVQNLSLGEIAEKMGCSYKVAFKHKDAGLKKIRRLM